MACASITGRDAQSNLMAPYHEKEAAMRCFFSLDYAASQRGERSARDVLLYRGQTRQTRGSWIVEAGRVAETARAYTRSPIRIGRDVENDVVGVSLIA
jgi:hypothetical protein